jgi:hypothetical protein
MKRKMHHKSPKTVLQRIRGSATLPLKMLPPSCIFWGITIVLLWTLWFIAVCAERRWFHGMRRDWINMPTSAKAVMAVLCAYYTVTAQKPSNVNNTATAILPDTGQLTGGGVQQQLTQPFLSSSPGGPLSVQSEPSRIVLQATLSADPRATAAFSGEPGWSLPAAVPVTPKLSALSFACDATNPASPVCFSNTVTGGTVQALMLVTRGDAADLATLVDAPETARLRLVSDGRRQTEPGAAEESLTRQFVPGRWQLVTVDFETPANLTEMFFGGTAGRPVWNRGWQGEIAEIVGFDTPPDADIRAGVANYLAIRWGSPLPPPRRRRGRPPSTPDSITVLRGVRCFS